ncbi:MAG: InlB B-repeat-containing protein, partial [Anaerovoracaceae bacterium]
HVFDDYANEPGNDLNLFAQWQANATYLNFDYNGATDKNGGVDNKKVPFDRAIGALPAPLRDGYTFGGWEIDNNGITESTIWKYLEDKTAVAQWTANKYLLNFDYQGATSGNTIVSKDVFFDAEIGILPNPAKTGYDFVGWKIDGIQDINMNTLWKHTSNKTAVAQWTPKGNTEYLAKHYLQKADGTYEASAQLTESKTGATGGAAVVPAKTNADAGFANFSNVSAKTTFEAAGTAAAATVLDIAADGSLVIKLYYDRDTFNVTYNGNGSTAGTVPTDSNSYAWGKTVAVDTADAGKLLKTGYTQDGWALTNGGENVSNFTMPVSNQNLYAIWNVVNYNINYDLDGSTVATANPSQYNIENGLITLNNPTKSGYTFGGWYSDNAFNNASNTIPAGSTGDKDFYAKWVQDVYAINYHNVDAPAVNDKDNPASYSVDTEDITLKDPVKTGYTFGGWYSDAGLANSSSTVAKGSTGDKDFYAKWTANKYNIAYDNNGGTGSIAGQNPEFDKDVVLSDGAGFTKPGYTLVKWDTQKDDSGTEYILGSTQKNLSSTNGDTVTLYAIWQANGSTAYKVMHYLEKADGTYDAATDTDNATGKTDDTALFAVKTYINYSYQPAKTTYEKAGAAASSSAVKIAGDGSLVIKLYYDRESFKVSYNANAAVTIGTVPTDNSAYVWGKSVTVDTVNSGNLARTGYSLEGWALTPAGAAVSTFDMPASDQVLYAVWQANEYTIAYDSNGGTGSISSQKAEFDKDVTLNDGKDFTREGYTLIGWNLSDKGTGTGYELGQSVKNLTETNDETITMYAVWQANSDTKYLVEHYLQLADGSYAVSPIRTDSKTGTSDSEASFVSKTKVDEHFEDYNFDINATQFKSTGKDVSTAVLPIAADGSLVIKLYYARDTYNTVYDANLPAGETANGDVPSDINAYRWGETAETDKANANNLERKGYTLEGWALTPAGAVVANFEMPKSDQTLYAVWKIIDYTITYDDPKGAVNDDNPKEYNVKSEDITFKAPGEIDGFIFDKWVYDNQGKEEDIAGITSGSTGNITVTAKWIETKEVTVSHRDMVAYHGGTSISGDTFPNVGFDYDGFKAEDNQDNVTFFIKNAEGQFVEFDKRNETDGFYYTVPFTEEVYEPMSDGAAAPSYQKLDHSLLSRDKFGAYKYGIKDIGRVIAKNADGKIYEFDYNDVNTETYIRPAANEKFVPAVTDMPFGNIEEPTLILPEDTDLINSAGLEPVSRDGIGLLIGDVHKDINGDMSDTMADVCENQVKELLGDKAKVESIRMSIVDNKNGNIYVMTEKGDKVGVLIPYPAGTDIKDEFAILHYVENSSDYKSMTNPYDYDAENPVVFRSGMELSGDNVIQKNENGLLISVDNFSPFAIAYKKYEAPIIKSKSYTITATAKAGGKITPSGKYVAQEGDNKDYKMIPNKGYKVKSVLVDGKEIGTIENYSFSDIKANHSIVVSFEKDNGGGNNGGSGTDDNNSNSPLTGDSTSLMILFAVLLMSAIGAVILFLTRRKKKTEK